MSSTTSNLRPIGRAEKLFIEAFERLRQGRPLNVKKGVRLSQAVIAREAGVDPSALRKSRFPELIEEIQRWVESQPDMASTPRQLILAARARRRTLQERIEALQAQRDDALSKLVLAEARILELSQELQLVYAQGSSRPAASVSSISSRVK